MLNDDAVPVFLDIGVEMSEMCGGEVSKQSNCLGQHGVASVPSHTSPIVCIDLYKLYEPKIMFVTCLGDRMPQYWCVPPYTAFLRNDGDDVVHRD